MVLNLKVQYVSDLHEKYPTTIVPNAPILALIGDIGNPTHRKYQEFLAYVSGLFEAVLVIMGNHEIYHSTIQDTERAISAACSAAGPNVHFLNRTLYIHPSTNTLFAGATLWSNIKPDISNRIACFRHILLTTATATDDPKPVKPNKPKLDVETYLEWHKRDLRFLEETVKNYKNHPIVLLTHYAPIHEANGPHSDGPLCSGFSTPLPHLHLPHVKAHLFGHTHVNGTWLSNATIVASNCRGYYPGETNGTPFDPHKTVSLSCGIPLPHFGLG